MKISVELHKQGIVNPLFIIFDISKRRCFIAFLYA